MPNPLFSALGAVNRFNRTSRSCGFCDPRSAMRRSSLRFVGFIAYPCLVRNPVHLPVLACIVRVRLFKVRCIRGGIRPDKSNVDGPALPKLLVIKLTASILELADHRLFYRAVLAVGPIDTPLVDLVIV